MWQLMNARVILHFAVHTMYFAGWQPLTREARFPPQALGSNLDGEISTGCPRTQWSKDYWVLMDNTLKFEISTPVKFNSWDLKLQKAGQGKFFRAFCRKASFKSEFFFKRGCIRKATGTDEWSRINFDNLGRRGKVYSMIGLFSIDLKSQDRTARYCCSSAQKLRPWVLFVTLVSCWFIRPANYNTSLIVFAIQWYIALEHSPTDSIGSAPLFPVWARQ